MHPESVFSGRRPVYQAAAGRKNFFSTFWKYENSAISRLIFLRLLTLSLQKRGFGFIKKSLFFIKQSLSLLKQSVSFSKCVISLKIQPEKNSFSG